MVGGILHFPGLPLVPCLLSCQEGSSHPSTPHSYQPQALSHVSRSQHPAHTLQLIPASERFSLASPWVLPLLFSLVCLPVSMTASFPVGRAEHSLGQEPTNASKNQKSVLCLKKAAAALTLEKADLQGLTDAGSAALEPSHTSLALRPAGVCRRPNSAHPSLGASGHSELSHL